MQMIGTEALIRSHQGGPAGFETEQFEPQNPDAWTEPSKRFRYKVFTAIDCADRIDKPVAGPTQIARRGLHFTLLPVFPKPKATDVNGTTCRTQD